MKMFKFFLLASCFLLLTSFSGCTSMQDQMIRQREDTIKIINEAKSSKIIVLDVYHNRCESCKSIEPIIEKLKKQYSNNLNLSFLKYDLSNLISMYNSLKIAKELGLENIYKIQRYSGVVLFIDTKTKEVVDTLPGEFNIERYNEVIKERLGDGSPLSRG